MKYSVSFNGDKALILGLRKYPEVTEVYGKLQKDFFGGGKCSFQIPFQSKRNFESFVQTAHEHNIEFNYLLNSACLNNREWTRKGQREINKLLDWLVDIKVDAVTVAIPYILELVKRRYPILKAFVSDLAYVDSADRAKAWEDLGAQRITLFNVEVNRNFRLIEAIRKKVKCELKLIANVNCLAHCPYYIYHGNLAAHASQSNHESKNFVIDYCRLKCRSQQLHNIVDFIRSSWIRPEDVQVYENLGIDMLKIIDRGMTTENLLKIVKAYAEKSYEGNLLDLFPDPKKSIIFDSANILHKIKFFFHPFKINVLKLRKFEGLLTNSVYVDNRKLDGFIQQLKSIDCEKKDCEGCTYCYEVAQKAVKRNDAEIQQIGERYKKCIDAIVSGDVFLYGKHKK
jgi:collagenase-like PrtC family protease